ncbi:MAG: NAD(P)H-dependent oxidoreductase [Candidatus Bathyarchaeota archaeon]
MSEGEDTVKILAICGSQRKGGTFKVLNSIKEEFPDVDYEILMLKDMNMKDCYGCYACINRGPEKCPLKDDRDVIIEKMEEADGVIFATPTNTRHITVLMKKFMDKLGYIAHRPYFFDKYAVFVATCKGFGADLANEYMSSNIGQYGFNLVSSVELYISTKSEAETKYNKEQIVQAVRKLISAIQKGERFEPEFGYLVQFHIMKAISELNKKEGIADYEYYKDKTGYYYDVKVPFYKKRFAKWIAGREIKKFVTNK